MGKKYKSQKRCSMTNKVINGKEVVLTENAVDYVKKLGYVIVERRHLINKSIAICILFLLIAIMQSIPVISALPSTCNNNTFNLWKFNEGMGNITTDSCENNYGLLYGGFNWVNGKYGKAIKLNGADSYILTPNAFTQNLTEFSFSVWIKKERNINAWETIFQRGNYYTNEFVELIYIGDTDELLFMNTLISYENLTNNQYHNIIGTYNLSADEVKLYIDGNLIGLTNSVQPEISATTQPLYIGVNYANGFIFNGTIDDLALYNKTLNLTEILYLNSSTSYNNYVNPTQINIFHIDFSNIVNLIGIIFIFIIALILFLYQQYIYSGGLLMLGGLLFMFNQINILISFLIIIIGIVLLFKK